jgi:hypothetical protein
MVGSFSYAFPCFTNKMWPHARQKIPAGSTLSSNQTNFSLFTDNCLTGWGPKTLLTGKSLYSPCFALNLLHHLVVHIDLLQVRLMICVSHLCCGQPPSLYYFASPYAFQGAWLTDECQTSFRRHSCIYPLRLLKSPASSLASQTLILLHEAMKWP